MACAIPAPTANVVMSVPHPARSVELHAAGCEASIAWIRCLDQVCAPVIGTNPNPSLLSITRGARYSAGVTLLASIVVYGAVPVNTLPLTVRSQYIPPER